MQLADKDGYYSLVYLRVCILDCIARIFKSSSASMLGQRYSFLSPRKNIYLPCKLPKSDRKLKESANMESGNIDVNLNGDGLTAAIFIFNQKVPNLTMYPEVI